MVALLFLFFAAGSAQAKDLREINAAKRFIYAVNGNSDYEPYDFIVLPDEESRKALSVYSDCRAWRPTPPVGRESYGQITIIWSCPGVSQKTPMAITLHFIEGRISLIELHNADLKERD